MQTARSASRAASPSRSTVETTTTVSMPRARQARTTRTAISPRLATSTRRMVVRTGASTVGVSLTGPDPEQHLLVLDHLGVAGADLHDLSGHRCDHRVHQLHDLDDRQLLVRLDGRADLHERRLAGGRGGPEGTDGRRADDHAAG